MVRPYEIWIGSYYHMSGGVRALHILRDELLKRDIKAWMQYDGKYDPKMIGVYPEIIPNNPQQYSRVVRWKLNTADLPKEGPIFAWESGMGEHPLLTVNLLEPDLWTPNTGHRSGVAYWVGKGVKDERFIPDRAIEITRKNYTTRRELSDLIRGLDYLISFDPFTAVNLEAVVAGTPVLIRNTDTRWTREVIEQHDWLKYGVAWSMDSLDQARRDVHLAHDHYYQNLVPVFDKRIDEFVEITQEHF